MFTFDLKGGGGESPVCSREHQKLRGFRSENNYLKKLTKKY